MKILLYAGLLMVVLGVASLVVPIPHTETEGIKVGQANFGVETVTVSVSRPSSASC
ncbi:MAG: hypothetical protein WCC04_10680 [Terriglobales bacterium]